MATKKINIALPTPATATDAVVGEQQPQQSKISTTTLRFERPLMAKLKIAAIGRNQSFQAMVESALAQMFERDGVKVPGLRK